MGKRSIMGRKLTQTFLVPFLLAILAVASIFLVSPASNFFRTGFILPGATQIPSAAAFKTVGEVYEQYCDESPPNGILLLQFRLNEEQSAAALASQEVVPRALLRCKPLFPDKHNIVLVTADQDGQEFYQARTSYADIAIGEDVKVPDGVMFEISEPFLPVDVPLTSDIAPYVQTGFHLTLRNENGQVIFDGNVPPSQLNTPAGLPVTGQASGGGPDCPKLYDGGRAPRNAMDLLIMNQGFATREEVRRAAQVVTDFMVSELPFSDPEFDNTFTVRYIDRLYQHDDLLCGFGNCYCDEGRVEARAAGSGCPYDVIAILVQQDRWWCTDSNVASISGLAHFGGYGVSYSDLWTNPRFSTDDWDARTPTHETGHAEFWLADEYVYSGGSSNPTGNNCAQICSEFGNLVENCQKGCTTPNFYRPSADSVMRNNHHNDPHAFNAKSRRIIENRLESY